MQHSLWIYNADNSGSNIGTILAMVSGNVIVYDVIAPDDYDIDFNDISNIEINVFHYQ